MTAVWVHVELDGYSCQDSETPNICKNIEFIHEVFQSNNYFPIINSSTFIRVNFNVELLIYYQIYQLNLILIVGINVYGW